VRPNRKVAAMHLSDRELVMRMRPPKPGADWFRIEDHDSSSEPTKVYIYDEIGYWGTTADDFVQQFKDISTPEIHVHINSPGGRVWDGIAIYNAIRSHPSTVTTIVDALAASAASFIHQAGNVRQVTKNATMMIHNASGLAMGNAKDLREMADLLDKLSKNIASIYSEQAGGTVDEWLGYMDAETWYDSQEALDAGLAQEILKHEDKQAEDATAKWDLSVFAHKGRSDAPSPEEIRERFVLVRNRAKEAPVSDQNDEKPPAGEEKPPATEEKPPAGEEKPPATEEKPPAGDAENKATPQTVVVNGVSHEVPAPVAQHLSTLENFRDESVKSGRKNFVASLASGPRPKVIASQIEQLEAFALSLSPEQFESWKASWDAAPGQALLGTHAGGISNADGNNTATEKLKDEIEICEETIAHHKRANMPQDQIEKTASYQRLQELKAQLASTS
jgi:ATP-dependent Clp endopeptidase proteolytic subunit ClpP